MNIGQKYRASNQVDKKNHSLLESTDFPIFIIILMFIELDDVARLIEGNSAIDV